jgi:hypothetical protein
MASGGMIYIPCFVESGSGIQIIIIIIIIIIIKRGRIVLLPTPTGAEVKKTWVYTSTPSYVFIA